jgi:hypothetical protein
MKPVTAYFVSSFVLHLIWENVQMPLFESGEAPFWDTFTMCLWATATGDMLFMLTLYLTVALIHRGVWWSCDRSTYSHPATWIVPVILGVLLAVSFELWAVHATDRWVYSSMPIIPVIKVGLTPVLQMILIPLATTACACWLTKPGNYGKQLNPQSKSTGSVR